MAESYGGPVGVVVWGEDMVRHVTLMVRGGGPSSEAVVGLGRELAKEFELAMKLSSNSLARWSKDEMEDDFSWLYHIRAGPLRVVGKVRHIKTSKVS
ncbi:hypothetical protein BHM03_00003980 [Ensete ventricosum]|nr:hypothetical protein BHM03_00003980 [Ensete ventricosum]